MFTGIVEQAVRVRAVEESSAGRRLVLAHRWGEEVQGQSVAINGCCLSIAAIRDDCLEFDAVPETLRRTNLSQLAAGDRVHVERPLRVGDRVDGHFVQGHVDGLAELIGREAGSEWRLRVLPPAELARFVSPKGSVALDGVSLTVADLIETDRGTAFDVVLIPTTREKTLLGERPLGWPMNFEADMLVKSVIGAMDRLRG